MTRWLAALALALIGVAVFAVTAQAEPTIPTTICHNGETLVVDDDGALNGHLGHGDTLGACEPPPPIDYCDTLPGVQAEDADCPPPVEDVCPNIEGVQETVPPGFGIVDGECVLIDITPFCAPPLVLDPETGLCVGGAEGGEAPRCQPGYGPYGGKDTDESDPYHNQECCPDSNPVNQRCDDQEATWDAIHSVQFLRFAHMQRKALRQAR